MQVEWVKSRARFYIVGDTYQILKEADVFLRLTKEFSEDKIRELVRHRRFEEYIHFLKSLYNKGHKMALEQIPIWFNVTDSISITREFRTYRHTSPLEFSTRSWVRKNHFDKIQLIDRGFSEEDKQLIASGLEEYFEAIKGLDLVPDRQRDFYPLLMASRIVGMMNLSEFIHIIRQRYLNQTGKADDAFREVLGKGLDLMRVENPFIYALILFILGELREGDKEFLSEFD